MGAYCSNCGQHYSSHDPSFSCSPEGDPLQAIRDAVLQTARSGEDPAKVIALLVKISIEIGLTTDTLNEDEMHEFVKVLWGLALTEHQIRVATAIQPTAES
jgi:hypothetical protein